jgi:hypothetical protein
MQTGYAEGNLLNLLCHLKTDLRGFDFSHLAIRQASLQIPYCTTQILQVSKLAKLSLPRRTTPSNYGICNKKSAGKP